MMSLNRNKKYDLIKFVDKIGFYHGVCSGDIDNDGDLDIFVLGATNSYFLINDGKGNFSYSTSQIDVNNIEQQYTCELVDIDKDGYLDLMILNPVSKREFVRIFPSVYEGKHVEHPKVEVIRAKEINIEAAAICYADGERIGPMPARINSIKDALLTWKA